MRPVALSFLVVAIIAAPLSSEGVTFDGATRYQTVDAIGVNVNYRGWEGTNLVPVLRAFMDEAGTSFFRLTYDLSDWEAINDDADSNTYNWDYYNPIYSSPEFNRLWDMIEYLNDSGYTNRVCLTFMGWGPAWMMDADGRSLKPGMEDEWAEMIASALIYARNTRGLELSLVCPNNEPDIYNEGIRITTAAQYTNTVHRLAAKLDAAGMTNLWFIGPDRSNGPTNFLSEMAADSLIMSRQKHFGVHAYNNTAGNVAAAYKWATNSAYPDRSVWITEFNTWCSTCDSTDTGFFDIWENARGTAEHMLYHLQGNASGAIAWEGYDSIYAHHYTNWGYFGLMRVDNINAPTKTYTPRKSFYTVAQLSKWVRPGAERIAVNPVNTGSFTYLTAFKHGAQGQVTICGINTGGTATLTGSLQNLPPVSKLAVYYTSQSANLAFNGYVNVSTNGSFTATIPGNSVFTLVGFDADPVTLGVSAPVTNHAPGVLEHYYVNLTNPVARAQFDLISPTADVDLFVSRDHPSDGVNLVRYSSQNPGTNAEQVVMRSDDGILPAAPGRWYVSVLNNSATNAGYSLRAMQWGVSGAPLRIVAQNSQPDQLCLWWNTLPQASYVVQAAGEADFEGWHDVSETLVASGTNETYCLPLDSGARFFRVLEGVAVDSP